MGFNLALLLAFLSTGGDNGVAMREAPPKPGVCLREGSLLVRAQPVQVGTKLRAPKKARHVAPAFPELPAGTTVGGLWVGEALIDQRGKIATVWAIRPLIVRPAFPPVNEAIVSAIWQWEFEPSMVEKVAVPVCLTVTVNINLREHPQSLSRSSPPQTFAATSLVRAAGDQK